MAKITTITNPLTGQPAQVDQLDHTAQQIDDGIGFESTEYPGCYYRTVDGVVEWVNPPMQLSGVDADGNVTNEYRTTERYLGKPVYVIAYDYGNLPNSNAVIKTVEGVKNVDKVVSVFGYTSDRKTLPTFSYAWSTISTLDDAISLDAYADPTYGLRINITTQKDRSSATAIVIVKYTKSTD